MAAAVRCGWRRVAGSALDHGPKASVFLHHVAPAARGKLQQAASMRPFPNLTRPMSSKTPKFVLMDESKFKELLEVAGQVEELKLRDANYLRRFHLLASFRGALPLKMNGWDRFVLALKDQFVPSNTEELRWLLFKVTAATVSGSVIGYECSSWKAVGGTFDQFVHKRHPWIYAFIHAFLTSKKGQEGEAAQSKGEGASSDESGAAE